MPSESLESYRFSIIDFSDASTYKITDSSSTGQECDWYDWYLLGESLEARRIRQIKNVKV